MQNLNSKSRASGLGPQVPSIDGRNSTQRVTNPRFDFPPPMSSVIGLWQFGPRALPQADHPITARQIPLILLPYVKAQLPDYVRLDQLGLVTFAWVNVYAEIFVLGIFTDQRDITSIHFKRDWFVRAGSTPVEQAFHRAGPMKLIMMWRDFRLFIKSLMSKLNFMQTEKSKNKKNGAKNATPAKESSGLVASVTPDGDMTTPDPDSVASPPATAGLGGGRVSKRARAGFKASIRADKPAAEPTFPRVKRMRKATKDVKTPQSPRLLKTSASNTVDRSREAIAENLKHNEKGGTDGAN